MADDNNHSYCISTTCPIFWASIWCTFRSLRPPWNKDVVFPTTKLKLREAKRVQRCHPKDVREPGFNSTSKWLPSSGSFWMGPPAQAQVTLCLTHPSDTHKAPGRIFNKHPRMDWPDKNSLSGVQGPLCEWGFHSTNFYYPYPQINLHVPELYINDIL